MSQPHLETAEITLPASVLEDADALGAHVHAVWARRRRDEGWRHGPNRDDTRKTHPGLVPYRELPESEREYDRETALETVRALMALGYRIEEPGARTTATGEVPR